MDMNRKSQISKSNKNIPMEIDLIWYFLYKRKLIASKNTNVFIPLFVLPIKMTLGWM